ncbi:MAG: 3'(2'),5'-bisphosphate nucleotidase CysQ [Gammaproteobacteria bacterium]
MNSHVNEYRALIEPLDALSREAAVAILDIYGSDDFGVTHKSDDSPLTAADLASHKLLCRGLALLSPKLPILSEENAEKIESAERLAWGRYWLIDPLDGTKEFVKRNGEFTINIALIEDGKPVLGVVHVPVTGMSYIGMAGQGAESRSRNGERRDLQVAGPVSARPVRIVGSRSHGGGELENFAARLGEHEFLAVGSALKFCMVASGEADVYPRLKPTCEWDTAAGQAVLEAAGGEVIELDGKPMRYNAKTSLVNPSFLASGDPTCDYTRALA